MSKQTPKKLAKQVKKLEGRVSRFFKENPKSLINHKQLAARLDIDDAVERQVLAAVIESMIKEGLLDEPHIGKFIWKGPLDEMQGLISFNRSGNAFVEIAGFAKDIMIPEQFTWKALDGDLVAIRLLNSKKGGGRAKGKVIEIIERARESFPGVVFKTEGRFYMLPDNQKISVDFYIPSDKLNGAKEGEKVVVQMVEWENMRLSPIAHVTDLLGMPGDMKAEGDAILA